MLASLMELTVYLPPLIMLCAQMKYALLAPFAAHSVYKFVTSNKEERDLFNLLTLPVLLLRLLYSQLWITISRFQTARSKRQIVTKSLDFEQVDRERNW
jgi:aldehyde decarbonylase